MQVLAGASIVSFAVPYVALPTMRSLYNSSLEPDSDVPVFAYILLAAALMALASVLNFGLLTQRRKFRSVDDDDGEDAARPAGEDMEEENKELQAI